ncbi:MAG: aminoacyl-tRNA hydrolase [Candidatus Buchananbacteria bacterium]|nr:aminoacyl-tRNA hydrolase [Candidatus Buchananbacteria bacterium]
MITHLVIGLGNPGTDYKNTWHNLGAETLNALIADIDATPLAFEKKFNALISRVKLGENELLLAAPQTFMNRSGESVFKLLGFYKLSAKQLIVVQDDIDLPLGTLRITSGSSAGGHNGVKSIIEQIGSQEFLRLKLGVATPGLSILGATEYVLQQYSGHHEIEKEAQALIKNAIESLKVIINESPAAAMNKFN